MNQWPRLSADLPGTKHPDTCQGCGRHRDLVTIWQECDEHDQPELIFVVLCKHCSDRLIEPHPRLYKQRAAFDPMPGVMHLCIPCRHRDGTRCANMQASINGGPGLKIIGPKPSVAMVDGRRNGRRCGWREVIYPAPPIACTGFEVIPGKEPDDGRLSCDADPNDPHSGQQ